MLLAGNSDLENFSTFLQPLLAVKGKIKFEEVLRLFFSVVTC